MGDEGGEVIAASPVSIRAQGLAHRPSVLCFGPAPFRRRLQKEAFLNVPGVS